MKNRFCWTIALCLGLMTLLGGSHLWAADPKHQADEHKAKMEAEGWKQISEGVFERQLGENRVEHLGYGKEGLAWTVGELSRKLENLREEYETYPSEKLARIIDELNLKIVKAKRELWNLHQDRSSSRGLSSMTEGVAGGSCSNICYSATANAYGLTSTQGVADAKFNSACGYSGDTYAYAYARATLNGTTTTVTQSTRARGPR